MEIKKCQEKDSKAVYNLIGELEEGTLDFSKFELAFKSKINNKIFNESKDNDFYSKFHNVHRIQNKYIPEDSMLVVNSAFILLESNILKPTFMNILKEYKNLFVCDFKNKDYFWLNELVCL